MSLEEISEGPWRQEFDKAWGDLTVNDLPAAISVIQTIDDNHVRDQMLAIFLGDSLDCEDVAVDQYEGKWPLNVDTTCVLLCLGADPFLSVSPDPENAEEFARRRHHWLGWLLIQYRCRFVPPDVNFTNDSAPINFRADSGTDPVQALKARDPRAFFESLTGRGELCQSSRGAELLQKAVVQECDDRDAGQSEFSDLHPNNRHLIRTSVAFTVVMVVLGADPDAPGPNGSAAEIALKRNHWIATMLFEWRKELMASHPSESA